MLRFLFVYFYFSRTLIESYNDYILEFNDLSFMKLEFKTSEIVVFLLDIVLFLASILVIKSGDADNSVSTRKKVVITMFLFGFSFMMLFLQKPLISNGLIFMVIAIFISMALSTIKKSKIVDIIMVVMLVAIIVNQYLPLFGIVI